MWKREREKENAEHRIRLNRFILLLWSTIFDTIFIRSYYANIYFKYWLFYSRQQNKNIYIRQLFLKWSEK